MKINRRFLYTGVFFLAAGGVAVAARAVAATPDDIAAAFVLWPVAVIAIGIALLLRRTRFGLAGGMIAAALPGLLLGGAVLAAPALPGACISPDVGTGSATRQGTFTGGGSVNLRLACGDLTVTAAPGGGWLVQTSGDAGVTPVINAGDGLLSVTSTGRRAVGAPAWGGEAWHVTLPESGVVDLAAQVNAGRGTFDLAGARLGAVRLGLNAGEATVDLGAASVGSLSVHVNAGQATVMLPAGQDLTADLSVDAGAIRICVPDGVGLRLHEVGALAHFDHAGLVLSNGSWISTGDAAAVHHADVSVTANVGSVDINPEGGCK